jgi:hypothetical protein
MKSKIMFVKEKEMEKFSYSFEERELIHEGGIPLPPQP